jgi:hypothetical protein
MKVALLLSGLARKVEEGYKTTWGHLIDNYDVDIYLHVWKDEEWDKVSKFYPNAKSIHIQEPFKFTKYKEGIKLPHNDTSRPLPQYDVMSCFRQFPMVYSWQNVYQQMYDTQIQYDVVIRSRYDLGIFQPLNLENLDCNLVNHSSDGKFLDDNLCVTNQENAESLYYGVFYKLVNYAREKGYLGSAEESWTEIVNRANLITHSHKNLSLQFQLLRENWLWWGDQDGNIISDKVISR